MNEFDNDLEANTAAMKRLMRWFTISSLTLVFGVGGWAVAAKVESAVVAGGTFVVQSSAQAVQHLEGGVVGAILVKDGQHVQEGQVLVRLDAARVTTDTSIIERKSIDLIAEKARLEAERLDSDQIQPPHLAGASPQTEEVLKLALEAQQSFLIEKRSARSSQLSQLTEAKTQIEAQLVGLKEQLDAVKDEMGQAEGDLEDKRVLDKKGLIRRPVLRQAERDVSRLQGQIADAQSRIAQAKSQLAENAFKTAEVTKSGRSEILRQLQGVTEKLAEAEQSRMAALDRMGRLEIRAPRTGTVQELAIHTVGGIVGPGQTLMQIIPANDTLLVTAKISPTEIDQVHVGQHATVKISSFKMATPPELDGTVTGLSADKVVDERSGQAFFKVNISIAPGERSKLEGK